MAKKTFIQPTEALQALQMDVVAWAESTFPLQTAKQKAAHLVREAEELRMEPDSLEECADCLLLLLEIAKLAGADANALIAAARAKFQKCQLRKWGPADSEGVYHHV